MRRRGSYAVEFALVLPVLFLLTGGLFEYGRYFDQRIAMVGVVREAVRAASMANPEETDDPTLLARELAEKAIVENGFEGAATVEAELVGEGLHQRIVVSASIPYEPVIGVTPVPARVGYSATMRMATAY